MDTNYIALFKASGDMIELFNINHINSLPISQETKNILCAGLSSEAGPFFSFGKSSGAFLQTVADEFKLENIFKQFIIIGFNAYGDPICINLINENIVYLNHDDNFGIVYLNKTLAYLIQYLLVFRDFIYEINISEKLNYKFLYNKYLKLLKQIYPKDLKKGNWDKELFAVIEEFV